MGNLKDELIKLNLNLSSEYKEESEKAKRNVDKNRGVQDETAWKKGVRPLRKGSGKVSKRGSKSKKPRLKTARKRKKDSLPSLAAIQSTYGDNKGLRKPAPRKEKKPVRPLPGFDDLLQVTLTRTSDFKEPDAWVQAGAALQSAEGGSGRVLPVRMGIDFGTCYTKVALRAADKVFFVDWDGVRYSNQHYFLPGEISLHADGSVWLGRSSDGIKTFGGLKIPFLSPTYAGDQDCVASVAFIAWIMRYARAWLYRYHGSLVKNRKLAWEVNIGCPTAPYCSTKLSDSYRGLGLCAWQLSQNKTNISLAMVNKLKKDKDFAPEAVGLDNLEVIPEFAAQVAGYVKSAQRIDGLHLLADIGAGTMDIVVFNIYCNPGSDLDRLPIFAGKVEPLGTHIYMSECLSTLPPTQKCWKDLGGLPTPEQLISEYGINSEMLSRVDEIFSDWVKQKIWKILGYTKAKRYPGAREWKEGIRTFLAGGGSTCEVYKNGVNKAFSDIRTPPLLEVYPIVRTGDQ